MDPLAATPRPPYYAVVFTSLRSGRDAEGYARTAERMMQLAAAQPGFLGVETARDAEGVGIGVGITVSYWSSLQDIRNWKRHVEHQQAQQKGRSGWYRQYVLRICRVEDEYGFDADGNAGEADR